MISTNTVAQGKAREFGLEKIIANGSVLNHAIKGMKWPGLAAVEVSLITLVKGKWNRKYYLNGSETKQISPFLDEADNTGTPFPLFSNEGKSYQGSIVLGKGFILEPSYAKQLISEDSKNQEVIFPYLNGDDLNNNPDQSSSRFVINFHDWKEDVASTYLKPFEILCNTVKAERWKKPDDFKYPFWFHWRPRNELYRKTQKLNRVLVTCRVSKYVNQSFVDITDDGKIFDVATTVVMRKEYWEYAFLQSSLHDHWAWKYASTLESRIRYVNVDCIDTFPILEHLPNEIKEKLDDIGEEYHMHRKKLMLGLQLGLTKTYNLFHSEAINLRLVNEKEKQVITLQKHLEKTPSPFSFNEAIQGVVKLREFHKQMDGAVLEAYGWSDIQLRHDFYDIDNLPENDRVRYTIHPEARKEVLKRLLQLNHERYAEEVAAGLHDKKKTAKKEGKEKKGKKKTEDVDDGGIQKVLFPEVD